MAIAYQRSKFYGLGQVSCWVDDDMRGTRTVDGYWDIEERNMGVWVTVQRNWFWLMSV